MRCRGDRGAGEARLGCIFHVVHDRYISMPVTSRPSWRPAGRKSAYLVVTIPQVTIKAPHLRRNLEAPDMQGSEQNMDSLPLRHRSIAICNPSPAPPMTASSCDVPPRQKRPKYRAPGNGRPLTGKQSSSLPVSPSAQSTQFLPPFPPPSGVAPRIHHGANTRFDTLSYEPYVPLQVAVTQQ